MHLVVRAFPVLPSKEQDVEAFARELAGPRQAEAREFYGSYGVARETWHFQPGPFGSQVIVVTEVEDVEPAAKAYADAQQPFHRWFKEQVMRISAVDPNVDPLGPPSNQVFAWPPASQSRSRA
jgi:hypothetical protein